jgi:proteasome accessory factor A
VDGKWASYGTHENYLVDRALDFDTMVDLIASFLVTRQVFAGSGRVGLGQRSEEPGFQIAQRSDYIETLTGLATTARRSIVNTRDEPHADRRRWRRLHLIIGDANCFQVPTWLKMGTTSLVLTILENLDALEAAGVAARSRLEALRLADPVGDVQRVSRDLALTRPLRLADGRTMTALAIQQAYASIVTDAVADIGHSHDDDARALAYWTSLLGRLATDRDSCAGQVEWVAKLRLFEAMQARHGLAWGDPKLAAADLQWADLRPGKGLAARLTAAGAVDTIVSNAEVEQANTRPPSDTRASIRGQVVTHLPDRIVSVTWDNIIVTSPSSRLAQRTTLPDPYLSAEKLSGIAGGGVNCGNSVEVEALLAQVSDDAGQGIHRALVENV